MKKSYKYRCYPTRSQLSILDNILSMCRYLYNWSLEERIEAYKKNKKTISYTEQQNKLPELKKQRPWFKGIYSLVLDVAWRSFIKSLELRAQNAGKQTYAINPRGKMLFMWKSCTQNSKRQNCLFYGLVLPRDYNSALKILRLGLKSLGLVLDKVLEAHTIMRSIL